MSLRDAVQEFCEDFWTVPREFGHITEHGIFSVVYGSRVYQAKFNREIYSYEIFVLEEKQNEEVRVSARSFKQGPEW